MKNNIGKIGLTVLTAICAIAIAAACVIPYLMFISFNADINIAYAEGTGSSIGSESDDNVFELQPGEKIYCDATINDDFQPGSVMIVLDEQISDYTGLSEEFYSDLFDGIEYTYIDDLSDYGDAVENNAVLKTIWKKSISDK